MAGWRGADGEGLTTRERALSSSGANLGVTGLEEWPPLWVDRSGSLMPFAFRGVEREFHFNLVPVTAGSLEAEFAEET